MYNLFVSCQEDIWEQDSSIKYEGTRFIQEHTNEEFQKKYKKLDADAIKALMSSPALFLYETILGGDAKIGWITKIRSRNNCVKIDYKIDNQFPPIPRNNIEELTWDLNIDDFEFHRTHWALKDINLLETLKEAGLIAFPHNDVFSDLKIGYEISPKVFNIPNSPIENDLISVMMPFSSNFDSVYNSIKRVCKKTRTRCQRVDDIWEESEIIQDIFSLIYRSAFVICDFTGGNPNVFYETGIAHTLGKTVIPITQQNQDIPFDLKHHRYLKYCNTTDGISNFETLLEKRIASLVSIRKRTGLPMATHLQSAVPVQPVRQI